MPRAVFPYNTSDYAPAAPVLTLSVSRPASEASPHAEEVTALCDTGADLTCLPKDVIRRLLLLEVDEVEVAPYEGPAQLKPLYAARLEVAGVHSQIIPVISIEGHRAILGRDVLNSLRLELDGPAGTLTLL